MTPSPIRYRERLAAPFIWWVLAVLLALSCGVAVGFYLGLALGLAVGLVALAAATVVLVSANTVLEVDDRQLRVGRAMIELDYVGGCRALDEAATTERSGARADARAHLVLRPYIRTAVEITVDDPADPVPYWLVSSRRPQRLAAALDAARLATRG